MQVNNSTLLQDHTASSLRESDKALKRSASGGGVFITKPAMDGISEQQRPNKVSPCPRCHSLDTKFCYFNNHNVKQPRHFCKRCQRYWTAGGALRNVPVGAGRRKNKTSPILTASKLSYSDENGLVGSAAAAGMCYPSSQTAYFLNPLQTDGAQPHSTFECVAAMSTHVETDAQQEKREDLGALQHLHTGAFHGVERVTGHVQHREDSSSPNALPGSYNEKPENQVAQPHVTEQGVEIVDAPGWLEHFAKATPSDTSDESVQKSCSNGHAPVSAWSFPYMWPWLMPYAATSDGPTCNHMDQAAVSAAWASAVMAIAANILQTYPLWNPYGWGRDVDKSQKLSSLGKHGYSSLHEQEPLRMPKTLKVGDPEEAMHSSILTTLGLSNLSASSPTSVVGFFDGSLQSKSDVWQHKPMVESPQHPHREPQQPLRHGNPAAQGRSLAFQESG